MSTSSRPVAPRIQVGTKAPARVERVEEAWLERFSHLMGRPQHRTWLSSFTRFRGAEFELLNHIGFTLDQTLHGEQAYTRGPAPWPVLGEALTVETEIVGHQERANSRTGRSMHIVNFQTQFSTSQGLCVTALTTFIFL